ncbi:Stf0 family sulfotransferase [Marinobacter flavimaris]|uniref:Stf0 family sulfotransferase n=1 Tax=Marinobacter flavimaris TaxID=262076 RepID=UPI00386B3318
MKLQKDQLRRAFDKVPDQDFVNSSYDVEGLRKTQKVLVIFSTPRSGSTLFCDYVRQAGLCVPHEYFQPTDYMPILGSRWDCIQGEELNINQYFESLLRFRTSQTGWLGINVHGSHLNIFLKFFSNYKNLEYHFIHLARKDTIAQAVSYEKALQTSGWSMHFQKIKSPLYSFESIVDRLDRIEDQNAVIRCFLNGKKFSSLWYEDFISNPGHEISRIGLMDESQVPSFEPSLKKQKDELTAQWIRRFCVDFQEAFVKKSLPNKIRPKKGVGYYWYKLVRKL